MEIGGRGGTSPLFLARVRRLLIPKELREILAGARVKRVPKLLKTKDLNESSAEGWTASSRESSEP
jgi:hypothetical protein